MNTAFRIFFLLLGLAIFGGFVHHAGLGEIIAVITRVGWYFPIILIPYCLVYCADSLGWYFAFGKRSKPSLSYWHIFRIRWAGEALNKVIPSGYIGGEAVKVYLLHKRGISPLNSTPSVIIGRTLQTLSQIIFITLGVFAFWQLFTPSWNFFKGMMLALLGICTVTGGLFWLQRRGFFSILLNLTEKLHFQIEWLNTRKEKLLRIDGQILEFYRDDRKHFFLSAGAYMVGWLLDTLDILVASYLIGMPVNWIQALAIESFLGVARVVQIFIPGALGIQESGIVFLCRAAGLPDTFGIAYAVIRRGREIIYALLGWIIIYAEEATLKGITYRTTLEPEDDL